MDDIRVDMPDSEQGAFLRRMLNRLNICSKEYIIRQYDHEVRGGSAIKPCAASRATALPTPASSARCWNPMPVWSSPHGICPKFSDYDTYWMMANAMDEAIRNAVAVGGNPDALAGVDNFCWCDPVQSEKTPDGRYKLAQLVRACKALQQFSLAFGVPCISGKDSMKNDYTGGGERDLHPAHGAVLGDGRHQQRHRHPDLRTSRPPATTSTCWAAPGVKWPAAKPARAGPHRRPRAQCGRRHRPAALPRRAWPHGPARPVRLP